MTSKFHARLSIGIDFIAVDTADAWEELNAWADALRDGDYEGLKHLRAVTRVRPSFALSDIKQVAKPPADPEPVHILDPTQHRGW